MNKNFCFTQNIIVKIIGVLSWLMITPWFTNAQKVTIGETSYFLNTGWKLARDPYDIGEKNKWHEGSYINEKGAAASVPGNWDVTNDMAAYKGKVWYYTIFKTPEDEGGRILLNFEAVSMTYTVYINGEKVAHVLCGNYEEEFDIKKYLRPKENTLVVMVDNTLKWGAYYNWGGIRRPVKLIVRNEISVEQQHIIATPDIAKGTANITSKLLLYNASSFTKKITIHHNISFLKNNIAQKILPGITLQPGERKVMLLNYQLSKEKVHLWHFDDPNLYTATVQLLIDKNKLYERRDRFGIRKIEIKNQQFFLNDEPVRLAGYNWVADDRTTGNTLPAFRYKEDIDLMKMAGANFARLSHRPLPADVMDYLDEKGILTIAEFNNWPIYINAKSQEPRWFAKKLINQNYNHPCVVGWSVGNEVGNQKEHPHINEYVSSIIKYIKTALDSTRFVAYVSNTADFQENDAAQFGDLILINKYGNYETAVDQLSKRYPDKAVFMAEYGGYNANLIYDEPGKTLFPSLMVENLAAKKNIFGYALWTFNDYRSEYQAPNPATTTPLHQNRQWGIVDVYRNKKRSYSQMQNFYAPVKDIQAVIKHRDSFTQLSLTIIPRSKNDIPSFTLKKYKLTWQVINTQQQATDMGCISLPDVHPGQEPFKASFSYKKSITDALVKVSLLSPTGYVVKDTTLFLKMPERPAVIALQADAQIRFLLDKNIFSATYQLYESKNGIIKCIDTTTDHYLQADQLSIGTLYKFWITATNSYGESMPSDTIYYTPIAGYKVLPPVIWLSEPADKSFYTGMSYHYTDDMYEIRYGDKIKDTAKWQSVTSSNFGMMQVPYLQNKKLYHYQLRRITAFNATPSCWSEIKSIIPNAAHFYGRGYVAGYKLIKNDVMVVYAPPKNAKGYNIFLYTSSGKKIHHYLNQSVPEIIYLQDIANHQSIISVDIFPDI